MIVAAEADETALETALGTVVMDCVSRVVMLEVAIMDGSKAMLTLRPIAKITAMAEKANIRLEYSDKGTLSPYWNESDIITIL